MRTNPLKSVFELDRSRLQPGAAWRCTVGVAVPLLLAAVTHHDALGAPPALGALYTGIASYSGIYRARFRTMAFSGWVLGFVTALAVLVGPHHSATLLVVPIFAFLAALYSLKGPEANTLAVQATGLFLVFTGFGLPSNTAWANGGLVVLGALFQLFLMTILWPLDPRNPERTAVGMAFESMANFVSTLGTRSESSPQIPDAQPFLTARTLLEQANRFGWRTEHDRLLAEMFRAESLRASLVGFARADDVYSGQDQRSAVRAYRVRRLVAGALSELAVQAKRGEREPIVPVRFRYPKISTQNSAGSAYVHWLEVIARLIAGQSNFPVSPDRTKKAAGTGSNDEGVRHILVSGFQSWFSALTQLPDIRSIRSVALRHSVRYALTVEVAVLLSRAWGNPHGYWLPLTAAFVLRQDYASTFNRGLSRLVGTLGGVLIASLLLDFTHPTTGLLNVFMIGSIWLGYYLFQAGYTIYTVALTSFVVFLVASSGLAPNEIGLVRLGASAAGIVLALGSYMLWPAWHWHDIWQTMGDAIQANVDYGETVLASYPNVETDPAECERIYLRADQARIRARALRLQAENLLHAAELHPLARTPDKIKAADDMIGRLYENAAEMLALEADWRSGQGDPARLRQVVDRSINLHSRVLTFR